MEPITLYITLLLAGFVLIGIEIFIPGGVLGIFGSIAWLTAAIIGGVNFAAPWNMLSAMGILFMGVFTFVIWIKYFPKSRIGRSLSLNEDGKSQKSHSFSETLTVGTVGEALSTLRPSGMARFDDQRIDVVADGEWIEAGSKIQITSRSGGHISVSAVTTESV